IVGGHGEERVIGGAREIQLTDEVTSPQQSTPPSPEYMQQQPQPSTPVDYQGQPTGVFTMPMSQEGVPVQSGDILSVSSRPADLEDLEALEKKFWALMRILAKRGLVTKEEFLAELRTTEGAST
ncbi:MAG TPA: hypothetical protein VGO62_02280, partial [Myxococcota bacterium]